MKFNIYTHEQIVWCRPTQTKLTHFLFIQFRISITGIERKKMRIETATSRNEDDDPGILFATKYQNSRIEKGERFSIGTGSTVGNHEPISIKGEEVDDPRRENSSPFLLRRTSIRETQVLNTLHYAN